MDKIRLVVYNEYALGYIIYTTTRQSLHIGEQDCSAHRSGQCLNLIFIGKRCNKAYHPRKRLRLFNNYRSRGTTIRKCTSMTPTNKNSSNQKSNV